jgi:hypothetical protein
MTEILGVIEGIVDKLIEMTSSRSSGAWPISFASSSLATSSEARGMRKVLRAKGG